VNLRSYDLWTGLMLMVLAGGYYATASTISDSLLTDAVGAAGLPKLLAAALGVSGALLAVRSQAAAELHVTLRPEPRAVGLALLAMAYIALLPWLGYGIALGLLIAAVAILGGARNWPAIFAIAVAAGIAFHVVFVRLLHTAMPAGILARWI
jgi:putative tricarboxylic transport membrane protein